MKKLFFLLLTFLAIANGNAQLLDPVKWESRVEKINGSEFNLIFEGKIEEGWHFYSQFTSPDGSMPLELKFENQKGNYELIGKTSESKTKKEFNDVFGVEETFFEKKAVLTQKVKILNSKIKNIDLSLDGQACIEGKCIQITKKLTFNIPEIKEIPYDTKAIKEDTKTTEDNQKPLKEEVKDSIQKGIEKISTNTEVDLKKEAPNQKNDGLLTIFILSFLGGLSALLTPCVFPMIPMTVSFFTKQSKTKAAGIRNSIFYGISIIIIYVALGLIVSAIFGIDALNSLSTNVWFNLIFFVLLIIFAISFLGAFDIVLPNSWANKVDRQADRGGFVGILFMALALAIVSFSCTGPIVGTLIAEASKIGGIGPIVGMFGFSLAIALPFMFFALFPGWLNSLPKSGGWLNTVKVSLGFLELAFAFKFLSNADLVLQLHLLEREVFLAIWIAIFGVWAIYLLGKISLPHDDLAKNISVGRLLVALLVSSFTIYLIPGLWGAPLKIISGFTPPMTYSESPMGFGNNTKSDLPENANLGPNGLIAFDDYEKGLAFAKKTNKPILLDFTGFACANCRKMEEQVWSSNEILPILKDQIVLISLYGDDKRPLSESDQYVSKITGNNITTIGKKWSDFQISRYNINAQPYYVILDSEGNDLNSPIGYTPNAKEYKTWLENGISKFKK
jgi:thiol:disulfide interchange protein